MFSWRIELPGSPPKAFYGRWMSFSILTALVTASLTLKNLGNLMCAKKIAEIEPTSLVSRLNTGTA